MPWRAELQARDPRQPADAPLADRVGDAVIARQPGQRADVDDRAAARHQRRHRLDAEQRAGQVDPDDALPVGDLDLREPLAERDAGVVDETVDAPVGLGEPGRQRAPVLGPRDVELPVDDPVAEPGILLVRFRRDRTSRPRARARGPPRPLAAGRAGDDDDLALDAAHSRADLTDAARARRAGRADPRPPTSDCAPTATAARARPPRRAARSRD